MPLIGDYEPGTSSWARQQAEAFEASDGREGAELRGRAIVVLTSVGARTGRLRKTPFMRVEHEGFYAVVASKGGAPQNPAWCHNLRKNPHVELQDGAVKRDYAARELQGEEKAEWWRRAVEAWPDYAAYQTRTEREIPVFLLEPIG
jgi:F420H(2)-dependent quinone reductase